LLKGGTIQLFTLQERMSQPVELIVVLTQHLCWLLGTSVRKTRRFLRTEVLPLSVVDNLDFSANRLTALETLLMLASQGAYQAPHFKQ
jgi:hypothetical protein